MKEAWPLEAILAININSYFDVLLDNAFKVQQKLKIKIQIGLMNHWMMRTMEYFEKHSNKGTVVLKSQTYSYIFIHYDFDVLFKRNSIRYSSND